VRSGHSAFSHRSIFALAILASTAWTPVALASEFPARIPLSSLDGTIGFRLDGATAGDAAIGISVARAGDVNGDGFADIIIGAPGADPHGLFSGSSYVVFGKASGFSPSIDLSSLNGTNGFRLDGVAAGDHSGQSVAGAGDVNGDGFADVIIGAFAADPHGSQSGSSYVVFGKASGFAATFDLSTLNGSNGFRLDGVGDSGHSVASAGDVNGDGFADVIIADPRASASGSSYVVFGKASGFRAAINLSSLDGTNGFGLDGVAVRDLSGYTVAGAGDVNGYGFDDVIVGAVLADPHGSDSGSSYVVFGKASGFTASIDLSSLDGTNGFRLDGVAAGDRSGDWVAGAGDVNGDGFVDVIIGAFTADPHGSQSGSSYVVFGKSSGFAASIDLSSLNGGNGFRLDGVAASDYSGSVASAGDVNGDGFADVIIGAYGADPHGVYSGSSYVVFGRAPDTARTRRGSTADQYISGGPFNDTLKGLRGNDVLEGRGGADILIGGVKNDAASYLHAPAGVKASLANPDGNTGDAKGDSYTSIENLIGSKFADKLVGDGTSNWLTGESGPDVLTGQGGNDQFVLNAVSDSPPGNGRDQVTDFNAGDAASSVDKINLRVIDARTGPGNDAFSFIGTAAFSNTKGELRVEQAGTSAIVMGDVDGDGTADFEIELLNFSDLSALTAIDFRL